MAYFDKIHQWFLFNQIKLCLAAGVFGFIFVVIFDDAHQWEYGQQQRVQGAFFSSIDKRIHFVRYSSGIENSIRVILNFDAKGLSYSEIENSKVEYKNVILGRMCSDEAVLDNLLNGYYYDIDLRDVSSKSMTKNYFNMIIKYERCANW